MKSSRSALLTAVLVFGLGIRTYADSATSDVKPVQLALWPPDLQLVSEQNSIQGLRLNIYGRNANVSGVDLGFVHETSGDFHGVAFGCVSLVDGALQGVQWTWLYSRAGGKAVGWQSALVSKADGGFRGLQTSALNLNEGDISGAQISFLYNYTATHISGGQIGLVNRATVVDGFQLGLVNLTEQMNGLQLGLWNQIDSKETLNILPFVNWKF